MRAIASIDIPIEGGAGGEKPRFRNNRIPSAIQFAKASVAALYSSTQPSDKLIGSTDGGGPSSETVEIL